MKHLVPMVFTSLCLLIAGCTGKSNFDEAFKNMSAGHLGNYLSALASDRFQGRKPFTAGEDSTIEYLRNQFRRMGLEPGNGESYFQEVPMVSINSSPSPMKITGGKTSLEFRFRDDFVASTMRVADSVILTQSPMIFAGYGIVAPEYHWNDYAGLDVKGKTVVVLVNDPGFGSGDSTFFKGNTMTYYGRWTYKYEEAARQGAAALLIIHDTGPASYPWGVVRNSWSGALLHLETMDNNMSCCAVEGWISIEAAKKLFAGAGMSGYNFFREARKRDFHAFPLKQFMTIRLDNKISHSLSHNVLARITGVSRPDEWIIYSAHWDHLGVGIPINGDSIYNGAVDNGTGTAALLEIAGAFTHLNRKPGRSILFLAVTGEEQGLLGSEFYASHPVYPPAKTVADINMDAFNDYGRTRDFSIIGYGQSELEDYARKAAARQGRYITPDPRPEAGSFFRSDHFSFARVGVPSLYGKGGIDSEEHGKAWGMEQREEYTTYRYHKPSDNYAPGMNLEGVIQDARLLFDVGYTLSNENSFPQWKEGSEFKSIREGK